MNHSTQNPRWALISRWRILQVGLSQGVPALLIWILPGNNWSPKQPPRTKGLEPFSSRQNPQHIRVPFPWGSGSFSPTQILGHLLSIPSQNGTLFVKCYILYFFWDLKRITVSPTIIIQKCAPKTFAPPKTNIKFTPEMWWLNSFPVWL